MNQYKEVWVEQYENYQKQTIRNRCEIATSQGKLTLSVPVEGTHGQKCLTKDMRISDHGNWRHQHWQALVSSYGDSPFFEYYQDDIRPFFEKKWEYLLDFNNEICEKMCELLDISPDVHLTDEYQKDNPTLNTICPTEKEYYQVYKDKVGFLPDLSVLDLLFNMGNESILYLT